MKLLVTQSCPTLCNPMDCSLPGSSVHGILQERYWSGLPFPPPGEPPDQGIKLGSLALHADSLPSEPPGKPIYMNICIHFRIKSYYTHTHMKVLVAQLCPILCNLMGCSSPMLLCPWDFPGKNTGVGSHSLLQEIFPTQGWNPSLPHCRQIRFFII